MAESRWCPRATVAKRAGVRIFIGVLDLQELGLECGSDEVWYDIVELVRPMERRATLLPPASRLVAMNPKARPHTPLQPTIRAMRRRR